MKKFLATLIASILAAGGFMFMDATIPDRVETLENEASSLREEVSSLKEEVSENAAELEGYHVGDEIPCFPKETVSFDCYNGDDAVTVTITEFSATITQVITPNEAASIIDFAYPFRATAIIKGTTNPSAAGKRIGFNHYSSMGLGNTIGDSWNHDFLGETQEGLIKSDGSFEAKIPISISGKNAAFSLEGVFFY